MRLSIVALGHVHAEALEPLTHLFSHIEQLVLDVPPREPLAKHRAEFNRALDAATADWILIVREREEIDAALAQEIFNAANAGSARGFRMKSVPVYAGKPLQLTKDDGELRLFHRRNYLRFANKGEWDEVTVQGTVVRLATPLRSMTFSSAAEHREHLAKHAAPNSWLRHVLRYAGYLVTTKAFDANTRLYLWIESGYDVPQES
ncbi:MAG TPA: hypothetical protein VGF69_02205 [Thermoanaerobaculia bacterium]|jgi:hypothetical protein